MNARAAYEELTATIIAMMEGGVAPWVRPWSVLGASDRPSNYATRKAYKGSNVLALWMAQTAFGYASSEWMTFKQGQELGATVRKGQHGTPIVFAQPRTKTTIADDGSELTAFRGMILKGYTVFNRDQFDGLPVVAMPEPSPFDSITDADEMVAAIAANVQYGGNAAFYSPSSDHIQMPLAQAFKDPASFYGTLLHEHAHWTGAEHRLARKFGKRFGDSAYAFEELVAELAAAFITADLGIPGKLQHPEYLAHWCKVLGSDKNALFTACSAATRAAEYLHEVAALAASKAA